MPVFISHSSKDNAFVEKLARHLVQAKTHVWVDTWELKVGESLIQKVQDAIKTASALLVALSKASVESEWCKRELSAALMRELDEKRVLLLPLLLEDCDIPMFLREKRYADFRTNYDQGLRDTLDGIAAVTSDTQGRIENPEYHTDWGVDWGTLADGHFALRIMFVDHSERIPYCVVTEVQFFCDEALTRRMLDYWTRGAEWFANIVLLASFVEGSLQDHPGEFVLEDANQRQVKLNSVDRRAGMVYEVVVSARRLGVDTGLNTLTRWGDHVRTTLGDLVKQLPERERRLIRQVRDEGRWPDVGASA
jgi:hypothetical protein